MKRKDAIKIIDSIIYPLLCEGVDSKKLSVLVLNELEVAGMTPPFSEKIDLGCECGCRGRCKVGNNWDDIDSSNHFETKANNGKYVKKHLLKYVNGDTNETKRTRPRKRCKSL